MDVALSHAHLKRIALLFAWATSLMLAFAAGYYLRASDVSPPSPTFSDTGDVSSIERLGHEAPIEKSKPPRTHSPLDSVRQLADSGQTTDAIALAQEYLVRDPYDVEMAFLLSELLAATKQLQSALQALLPLTHMSHDPVTTRRLRAGIDNLVNAIERRLIQENDLNGLVGLYADLVEEEPRNDRHRLRLARWLLLSDKPSEAERLLKETGNEGVSQEEIDRLAAEVKLAQTALHVERSAGGMYTRVALRAGYSTRTLRLLIDTGASMTGIALEHLGQVGAESLDRRVWVHTANGVTEMPIYRVDELTAGPLRLESVDVLGLANLPGDADGLLGMDVLTRLPGVQTVGSPQTRFLQQSGRVPDG